MNPNEVWSATEPQGLVMWLNIGEKFFFFFFFSFDIRTFFSPASEIFLQRRIYGGGTQ